MNRTPFDSYGDGPGCNKEKNSLAECRSSLELGKPTERWEARYPHQQEELEERQGQKEERYYCSQFVGGKATRNLPPETQP